MGTNWSIEVENSKKQHFDFGHRAERAKELEDHFENNERHQTRSSTMRLPRDMNLTMWISTLEVTWEEYHTHVRLTTLEVSRDRYVAYLILDTAIFEESIPETPHAQHPEFERQASHIPGTHDWDQWETGIWHNSRQWEYPEICVYHILDILLSERCKAGSSNTGHFTLPRLSYNGFRGLLPYVPPITAVVRKIRIDRIWKIISGYTQFLNHLDNKSPVAADPIPHL
jgi:hypothetical protein